MFLMYVTPQTSFIAYLDQLLASDAIRAKAIDDLGQVDSACELERWHKALNRDYVVIATLCIYGNFHGCHRYVSEIQ